MITIRSSLDRARADLGWLKSSQSFSFSAGKGEDAGFGNLRILNEDRVMPGEGFGAHSHQDIEIVSYVLDGELSHRDSLGTGVKGGALSGVIRPGDVQRMSTGTGVTHSEFNNCKSQIAHFLQIWFLPRRLGVDPSYQQLHFTSKSKRGRLCLIASPDGRDSSLMLNADASMYAGLFEAEERTEFAIEGGRLAYVHVVRGEIGINDRLLGPGDAAMLVKESSVRLAQGRGAEVLVFDLAIDA